MPRGDADAELERERRQRQRQGCGDALENKSDRRAAVAHRASEFTLGDGAEIIEILHPDRIVEPPGLAEGGDDFRRRLRAHDDQRRIAGQPQHDKCKGDDEQRS